MAIAPVFAVGVVVFVVEADHIHQGEPVVTGDEIDRCGGGPSIVIEAQRRPRKAGRKFAYFGLAPPETAQLVAVFVVVFGPRRREGSHLIAAGADIPGFRDHFDPRQDRVLAHRLKEWCVAVEPVGAPPQ